MTDGRSRMVEATDLVALSGRKQGGGAFQRALKPVLGAATRATCESTLDSVLYVCRDRCETDSGAASNDSRYPLDSHVAHNDITVGKMSRILVKGFSGAERKARS